MLYMYMYLGKDCKNIGYSPIADPTRGIFNRINMQ